MLDALLAEARLRWGLDPADGVAVVPAERLIAVPLEPSRPALLVPLAVLRAAPPAEPPVPLPGRHGPAGRDALAVLRRLYPADHPVGRFGAAEATTVGALVEADLAAPLYLAPVAPELAAASPWGMPWISNRLRQPDGCPWDREQTHESLRNHLLEEAYEVYDALAGGATPELAAELGDLWLQVVLHAQLAAEAGVFDLADVQAAIASKIVRRHPHVFGDAEVRTATDVNRQWERIKQAERAAEAAASAASAGGRRRRAGPAPKSALDGVSRSMPALAASQEMQERAAHLGYDWPSVDGILGQGGGGAGRAGRRRGLGGAHGGAGRPPHGGRQPRPPPRRGGGGRAPIGQREVPPPVRDRGAPRRPSARSPCVTSPSRSSTSCGTRRRRSWRRQNGSAGGARMTIGNRGPALRPSGRRPDELRPVTMTLGVQKWAEGSCRIRVGDTEVLCAATIEDRVPPHLRGKGSGWVTAEYSMLPRSTAERTMRESTAGKIGGRTHEIQRLVGRSLRGVVDLGRLGERTVTVDCDVLQADGGTRTASITGGYVALAAALITYGMERLLVGKVAAVSVGSTTASPLLDLDYAEDKVAEVDFNVVGTDAGRYVELQGTAEGKAFSRDDLGVLLDLAGSGPGHALRGPGRRRSPPSSGDRAAPGSSSPRGRATSSPSSATCSTSAAPSSSTSTTSGSPTRSTRRARPSPPTPPSRPASTPAARASRRSPTTPAWRWTRSAAAPASGRAATRASRRPTRRTTRSCWRRSRACRRSGGARRYRCALALALPGRAGPRGGLPRARWRAARFEGRIGTAPRGANGFGYDPIFEPAEEPPGGATVGEWPPERKQAVSHRARAARRMAPILRAPRVLTARPGRDHRPRGATCPEALRRGDDGAGRRQGLVRHAARERARKVAHDGRDRPEGRLRRGADREAGHGDRLDVEDVGRDDADPQDVGGHELSADAERVRRVDRRRARELECRAGAGAVREGHREGPCAIEIASTLDSVNRRARVVPEAPPRGRSDGRDADLSEHELGGRCRHRDRGHPRRGGRTRWARSSVQGPAAAAGRRTRRRRPGQGPRRARRRRPPGSSSRSSLILGFSGRPRRRAGSARRACRHGTAALRSRIPGSGDRVTSSTSSQVARRGVLEDDCTRRRHAMVKDANGREGLSAGAIAKELGVAPPAVKKALAALKIEADFVKAGCAYFYADRIPTSAEPSSSLRPPGESTSVAAPTRPAMSRDASRWCPRACAYSSKALRTAGSRRPSTCRPRTPPQSGRRWSVTIGQRLPPGVVERVGPCRHPEGVRGGTSHSGLPVPGLEIAVGQQVGVVVVGLHDRLAERVGAVQLDLDPAVRGGAAIPGLQDVAAAVSSHHTAPSSSTAGRSGACRR